MIILICGTRECSGWKEIQDEINKVKDQISFIVCGGAGGVDSAAESLAKAHQINYRVYPAKWDLYGRPRAGSIRNEEMLQNEPDEIWAFKFKGGDALGYNKGTNNMIKLAEANGITIKIIEIE